MARARAIRILLLPFRLFSVSLDVLGRSQPNTSSSAFSFVFRLSKRVWSGAIRILLLPFRWFSVCLRWSGPEPSEFSFCLFVGPGRRFVWGGGRWGGGVGAVVGWLGGYVCMWVCVCVCVYIYIYIYIFFCREVGICITSLVLHLQSLLGFQS